MLTPAHKHRPGREREDLLALLKLCARRAAETNAPQLLSITLRVRHIDPLAVLQSAQNAGDWHAYFEHPAGDTAVAGIDAALHAEFSGNDRFAAARAFAKKISDNVICVGDTDTSFAGPHFFCAFSFEKTFGKLFVPRWQVARRDGEYTAVANVPVEEHTPLEATADRILAAHNRYQHFEYGTGDNSDNAPGRALPLVETGGAWYAAGVRRALEKIAAGECEKIVLARTFRVESALPISVPRALERLRARFPACHTFSFSEGAGEIFIGATPERLASVSGKQLQTEALAGTAPRAARAGDDARLAAGLIAADKDRREHDVVSGEIISRLAAIGINATADGPARLLELPNVRHLRTPISGEMPAEKHLLDVAGALHPTPAVGGVPREIALAAIPEIEPGARGYYAGALGWFDAAGDGRLLVGLRSALVKENTALLYAGAGIVAGSEPEAECRETLAKLSAMHEALG